MANTLKMVFLSLLLFLLIYSSSCSFLAYKKNSSFEKVKIGFTSAQVMELMGEPSHIDKGEQYYQKFTSRPCALPCMERLWFENKLGIDLQAWSVEIDEKMIVVSKYHWVSP